MIKINLLAFGIAKEILGQQQIEWSIASNATIEDFKQSLFEKHPELKELAKVSFAVNEAYCKDHQLLSDGDEVAIIPPVSGG